jgi:CheY-like chemotaxis protein
MPAIILTACASPLDLARGVLSGCDCFLVKPVTLATLRRSVVRSLGKAAAGRAADQAPDAGGASPRRAEPTGWPMRTLAAG